MSVSERRPGRRVVYGGRLALQAWEVAQNVLDEHVGHVVRAPSTDDEGERGEVGAFLGERVGRNLPASLAQCVRDVEDRVVVDLGLQREREDRQLVAVREEFEGPQLRDLS